MSQGKHNRRSSLRDASTMIQKIIRRATGSRQPPVSTEVVEEKTASKTEAQQWLDSLGPRGSGYDERIMPQLIDRIAQRYPDRVIFSYPKTQDPQDGYQDITYLQFAHAADRNAAWLEQRVGKDKTGQVIGFLASSKASSLVLAIGAAKIGCQILLMSPRNSLEGQLALLDALKCKYLVTPEVQLPQTDLIKSARPSIEHLILSELPSLLEGPVPQARPFKGTFDELRTKPLWWTHSSGTTSLPKPVSWSHGASEGMSFELRTRYAEGESIMAHICRMSPRFLVGFPLFHGAGMTYALCVSPSTGVESVLPPEGVPINVSVCERMFASAKAPFGAFLPPAVIEDCAKDSACFQKMIKQSVLTTGGAALSRDIGDKIVRSGVDIVNVMAATDTGMLPLVKPSEWYALHFSETPGYEFDDLGDGRFELVIRKVKETTRIQSCFEIQPNIDLYRTNDLYTRHPDPKKSHLWLVAGRSDDVIVLSNGEKFTPKALEEAVGASNLVQSALVFGMQREQAALLVEPRDAEVLRTPETRSAFIDKVWPEIEQANPRVPAHGRVVKTHVMLLKPEKQFLRTPKGSIMRRKMYELYAPEMNELYARYERASSDGTAVSEQEKVESSSMNDLKLQICRIAGIDTSVLKFDDNFFNLGADSLHVTQFVRHWRAKENRSIEATVVYNNPTIRQLHDALHGSGELQPRRSSDTAWESTSIAAAVEKLSKNLPTHLNGPSSKAVLLTGTSSGLGQHLLHVARQTYPQVYVLIRQPVSSDQRDIKGVTYLHADLAAPQLGLANETWIQLLHTVTHIVHNAWLVDFNHPLPRFTPNILGVRGLIDFAAVARHNPRIWFASSVGAVAGLGLGNDNDNDAAPVMERIIPIDNTTAAVDNKTSIAAGTGYAQSKRVSELLLARAAETCGVRSTVCRIGQIGGTSTPGQVDAAERPLPSWQARDYIPSLLRSARHLGAVPADLGGMAPRHHRLDWMPIDHVARAAFELLEAGDAPGAPAMQVFHLVNPARDGPTWADLLPIVRKYLAGGGTTGEGADLEKGIEVVSLAEFVRRLEKSAEGATSEDVEKNPGVKLLEFFRACADGSSTVPLLDTTQAQSCSATLRDEPAMNEKWMEAWMEEWFA